MGDLSMSLQALIALILLAVLMGAVIVICAVSLGAFVVFRTKREAHEPLFGAMTAGSVIQSDPFTQSTQTPPMRTGVSTTSEGYEDVGKVIFDQNNRFLRQYAAGSSNAERIS